MTATVTINPAVESVGIQRIALALGLNSVTDAEARVAWINYLRDATAKLYVAGDKLFRDNTANASAVAAAASQITVS